MRKLLSALAAVTCVAMLAAGCGSQPPRETSAPTTPSHSAAPVGPSAPLPANGSTLAPADFAAAIGRDGVVLVDTRTAAEFNQGHIQGAVNIDWEAGGFMDQVAKFEKTAPIALYCRSDNRSGQAMAAMQAAGYTRVFHLGRGIVAWQRAQLPVVT